MNATEIAICISAHVLIWWVFFTFVNDNSRFQKHRLFTSITNIQEWIIRNTKAGHPPCAFSIVYKNKTFAIGIIKDEVNYHYCTYRIFINGEEAGIYHILHHMFLNSYYFEPLNKRHESEVVSILHAGSKVLKKMNKSAKDKTDSWDEHSYFK
jgi:hypothetical protein